MHLYHNPQKIPRNNFSKENMQQAKKKKKILSTQGNNASQTWREATTEAKGHQKISDIGIIRHRI